ncbi:MAG: BlaI/MecI/CopY family transcriptional regulator [Deltaproteobacteria bacterium]|nr:BlaI/MecI/CopY family transcriptional regulator [Deltaproteobacteria bacterium]
MSPFTDRHLSRREAQVMDLIYASGEATVTDVLAGLPDPPSNSAIRALLRVLEEKGHLIHRRDGVRFIYRPTVPIRKARVSALQRLIRTFFGGSASTAVTTLIDLEVENLSPEDLDRIGAKIDEARRKGC